MMNRRLDYILRCLLLLAMSLIVAACSGSDDDEPEPGPDGKDTPQEVGRTVLVYMVARNTLGAYDFDTADIEEMKTAARNGAFGGNRLLLFHSPKSNSAPELKEVTSSGVRTLKKYDSDFVAVDEANMRSVIADVKTLAPARNYGIVLWSHANGWLQTGIRSAAPQKRAFGDDAGKHMNVTTLADVLRGEDFDFVYFDCCFMGGVEVAYELRDVTGRIVASVSELPSAGMPYDLTLPHLMADEADVRGAAQETFNYYNALTGNARTCTMSVIDTSGLSTLASAVRGIYELHPALASDVKVQQYVSINYRSYYNLFFDLGHYLSTLSSSSSSPELGQRYAAAIEALNGCVVYQAATPYLWQHDAMNSSIYEVKIDYHCGLSTFILRSPSEATTQGYNELAWYRDVVSALF